LGASKPAQPAPDSGAQTGIVRLIDAYRDLGHFLAHLDPLSEPRTSHPLLELSEFGFTDADLDRTFDTRHFLGLPRATLRELRTALRETYCRTIGVEYMHIQDTRIRRWLQERMEPGTTAPTSTAPRRCASSRTSTTPSCFERFLHTRYTGQKRFSLEGAETLIPLLEAIVEKAPEHEVREIIFGMAHRGRLNVLANILRKPYEEIFAQFEDRYVPESTDGDGDVKYHLGFSSDRVNSRGAKVHLSLSPNPSHLEAVDPVVEGRARAKQTLFGDTERRWGIPLLIHGDAAFSPRAGAGGRDLEPVAAGRLHHRRHHPRHRQQPDRLHHRPDRRPLHDLLHRRRQDDPGAHLPRQRRGPEATVFVAELALEFRQTFHRDVFIDMFCYRRHGHNEGDEPSFTQPIMYGKIRERPSLTSIYTSS